MPETFDFKFNLAQLATLLSTVSLADQEYDIARKNCYWFTCMVRELVVQIVKDAAAEAHRELPPGNTINRGSYLRLWHLGHYLSFFRLDGYSSDLAHNVYVKYQNEYREFLDRVSL